MIKKVAPSWQQNQFWSIKQWRDQLYLANIDEGLPKLVLQVALQCTWIYTTEDSDRTCVPYLSCIWVVGETKVILMQRGHVIDGCWGFASEYIVALQIPRTS